MHQKDQYFGFEISEELYVRSLDTIAAVVAGGSVSELNQRIAETLIAITDVGLDAYYNKPRDLVNLSSSLRKVADSSINAIRKGVHLVIRKVFTKTPLSELQVLANYMKTMLTHDNAETNRRFFITYPLNDDLYELSQRLLARTRQDPNVEAYRDDIIQSLADLIDEGIEAYYRAPVGMIQLGNITRKTADLGISTSQKGANAVIQRLFKVMPHDELIPLSSYFETLLHSGLQPASKNP